MDTVYIMTLYNITDTLCVNGYYKLNSEQKNILQEWYDDFKCSGMHIWISSDISITSNNFTISETSSKTFIDNMLSLHGNPCEILEHIDELNDMFKVKEKEVINNDDSDSDDSFLYTETVTKLIKAHIDGSLNEVNEILTNNNFDNNDDIVNKIKNNNI